MKIGYSFWGYLGDVKYDKQGNVASTPDGNATYSWSIINCLQEAGHEVTLVMPDRDDVGFKKLGSHLFSSFAKEKRLGAWVTSSKINYPEDMHEMTYDNVKALWDQNELNASDVILHEWRMDITGRNDEDSRKLLGASWQPDKFIQDCLIKYCAENDIKLVVFDLDYKVTEDNYKFLYNNIKDFRLFELGKKWQGKKGVRKVYIPFDFREIHDFNPKVRQENRLVYIGNRYERDWCIDKYIPQRMDGCLVYGNWNEGGRESSKDWPNIKFKNRLQTIAMKSTYMDSTCTILLAKREYVKYDFMTMRLIESVFFGCLPLFIEEYNDEFLDELIGAKRHSLIVHDSVDVYDKCTAYATNCASRITLINEIRQDLSRLFDVKNFCNMLLYDRMKVKGRKSAQDFFKTGYSGKFLSKAYQEV